MKTHYIFFLFIGLALAQLYVPSKMIFNNERVRSQGTLYKFKTRPVDPYDPLRGKYITLHYAIDTYATQKQYERDATIYVYITTDTNGFAKVVQVGPEIVASDWDYFKAKVRYCRNGKLTIAIPFNRYYMEENKAMNAELEYNNLQTDSQYETYAVVYIKEGTFVLTDVKINDQSIKDYVKK
jgi:uncharacterized membrane-anchored protein